MSEGTTLKSPAQHTRANRAGGRVNCLYDLANSCPLFTQPSYLVAVDYPARTTQRLSIELHFAQLD
jgi:hypothetical protein